MAMYFASWRNMIELKNPHYLDKDLMEKMCHTLAVTVFDTNDDPIAQFHQHDLSLLDSALNTPRQTFDGNDLYPYLETKAAVLYYSMNKNHPFQNGNKRISTASLLIFLYINGHWLNVPKDGLLNKTLEIAKSDPDEREAILKELEIWISRSVIKYERGRF
jgi:death on curing protein